MDHLRSVSVGVWLTRGSRDEPLEQSGIAHFIEHMLFKGTGTRSAEDIAQAIDSVGGHLDAFTAKEYASYYIKVLDEHLPFAWDILADIVRHPALRPDDIEREKKVILEEIKMVEDTPDDLVHELFTQALWAGHALGRPILGEPETVAAFDHQTLSRLFRPHLRRAEPARGRRSATSSTSTFATWSPSSFGTLSPTTAASPRRHRASCRRCRSAARSSSRATSAWASAATRSTTTIGTRATSSTRCSAAR